MSDSALTMWMNDAVQRHYTAVGSVAVEWTRFVSIVREMVVMLIDADTAGGDFVASLLPDDAQVLDALAVLSESRSPMVVRSSTFQERLVRIRTAAELCDHVVHDLWTFDPGTTTRWPPVPLSGNERNGVSMSTAEVEALAREIGEISEDFLAFRREFLLSVKLWPGQ